MGRKESSQTKSSLADEIAEPRPDINIKVAAFTVSEKSYNTYFSDRVVDELNPQNQFKKEQVENILVYNVSIQRVR